MRKILIGISALFLAWLGLDHRFCYSESSGTENRKNEYTAEVGYYYERYAYEEADNSGFGTVFLDMSCTGRFYDKITFGAGFVGHLLKCWEEKEKDYDDSVENKFVLKELYLKSDISGFSLVLGRHAIDQSFILTDDYEGITLLSDENERLDVNATYAIKTGSAFEDYNADFTHFKDAEGDRISLYGAELAIKAVPDIFTIRPYYYKLENSIRLMGIHSALEARITEDISMDIYGDWQNFRDESHAGNSPNGNLCHVNPQISFSDITLGVGYAATEAYDEAYAAESGDSYAYYMETSDYFSPLYEGNQMFSSKAETVYLQADYEKAGFKISFVYGQTRYDDADLMIDERHHYEEWDICIEYSKGKFDFWFAFSDVNEDPHDSLHPDDYKAYSAALTYRFE